MSETKLKPCPFCGGEASICKIREANLWLVKCWNTKTCKMLPRTYECERKEKAIEIWNTRKPVERIVERLDNVADKTIMKPDGEYRIIELDKAIEIVEKGGVE